MNHCQNTNSRRKLHGIAVVALMALAGSAHAQLTIPSADGSDGNLNVLTSTSIDLSQAVTGAWTTSGTGKGVYDPAKWAVVYKYNSVNIAAGQTLTFKNNASRAPVVWLVKGDVTIAGTLDLRGSGQVPGPGGFRGGFIQQSTALPFGGGFGPGGGAVNQEGSYSTSAGGAIYGNVEIIPLIGGSGSGSSSNSGGWSGTGGGGAILIAATGTITLSGLINANVSPQTNGNEKIGSGGAVRLVANAVAGSGRVTALGNIGAGRIRIESPSIGSITTAPSTVAVAPASPPQIWPAADAPTIRVVSVGGLAVPADPKSSLDASGADVLMNQTDAVTILIEATNIATDSNVTARITRKNGDPVTLTATLLDGGLPLSHWTISTKITSGFSAIQAMSTPKPTP